MTFRDRVHYDADAGTYHDNGMRYIFIKPEAFMGVALEMPEEQRPAIFEAMARTVLNNGGKSAAAYKAQGASDPDALLAVIAETAGQLGWGKWQITRQPDSLTVTVTDSPFAAGFGPSDTPVCGPIRGMLMAVGGMVLGAAVMVEENGCAATGTDQCTFVARLSEGAVA